MSKEVYKIDVNYDNSYELLRHFLSVYIAANSIKDPDKYIRVGLIKVLTYYVLKGYSEETKEFIIDSIPYMNIKNLNQYNSELQKKGYLLKDKFKYHKRNLPEELYVLKKYVDSNMDKVPLFVVKYVKKA